MMTFPKTTKKEGFPPVMNQREAAQFLGICPVTLKNLVDKGEIPCRKAGNRYLFYKPALVRWLDGEREAQLV